MRIIVETMATVYNKEIMGIKMRLKAADYTNNKVIILIDWKAAI